LPGQIIKKLGLMKVRNISYQHILNNLLDPSEGLGMKSRIHKVRELGIMNTIGKYYRKIGFDSVAELYEWFVEIILIYSVSEGGLGRIEVVSALKSLIEEEKRGLTGTDKLTTNLRKV